VKPRRKWDKDRLSLAAAQQDAIAVGDIVRAYDAPGVRDDTYHEGVVDEVEAHPGDLVHFQVTRKVYHGEEQQVTVECSGMCASRGLMANGVPCVFLIAKREVRSAQASLMLSERKERS
jgi:hypothetical protein